MKKKKTKALRKAAKKVVIRVAIVPLEKVLVKIEKLPKKVPSTQV
jgi:hypothetical protein